MARRKKKIIKKSKKTSRKKKDIRRIGVYIPLQDDIQLKIKELDDYIIKQGCQRLTPVFTEKIPEKGVVELYARVRYLGKRKAKKTPPITQKSLGEELSKLAKEMSQKDTTKKVNRSTKKRKRKRR